MGNKDANKIYEELNAALEDKKTQITDLTLKNSQLVDSLKNLQNDVENAQLAQGKSKKELSALELTVAEKDVTIDTLETKLKGMGEALDIQKKNSVNSEVVTKLEQKCQNYLDAIEDYKVRILILQSQLVS